MAYIDALFTPDQQRQWLSDFTYMHPVSSIPLSNADSSEGRDRFSRLCKRHDNEPIISLVAKYVFRFVPTFAEYWSCTCLTEPDVLTRISIDGQEVFDIHSNRDGVYVEYTFNERFSENLEQHLYHLTSIKPRRWGKGRIGLQLHDWESAWSIMDNPEVAFLIRQCNLSLMRRGKCTYWKNHNFAMAEAIYNQISSQETNFENMLIEEDFGIYYEGKTQLRIMQVRDRSQKLVRQVKKSYKKAGRRLCCQVCGFDFEKFYGEIGSNYIEVHHLKPIAAHEDTFLTQLEDVIILCANCHRMVHRRNPPFTPDELRAHLSAQGTMNSFD